MVLSFPNAVLKEDMLQERDSLYMLDERRMLAETTWDSIAESFDSTRRKPWQQCIDFISTLPQNAVVVDLGCGNGRHLIPCAQHGQQVIGVDVSLKLLHITRKKLDEHQIVEDVLLHADLVHLPLKDNTIDAGLYIASLHNIQGRQARVHSLQELYRILRPGGKALLSVWSRWQKAYRWYFLKEWFKWEKNQEFGDINIYWRQHRLNIPRFYHLYSKQEFMRDIVDAGFHIEAIQAESLQAQGCRDNFFCTVLKKP